MRIILIVLSFFAGFVCEAQGITSGYWLPLKRLQGISNYKIDNCDSVNNFPIQKIKFLTGKKISIFGFGAADPDICTIVFNQEKGCWDVQSSVLNTLYPQFIKGSRITLRILKDTLHVDLINNSYRFSQLFVRKYLDVSLTEYLETDLGNILIQGRYVGNEGMDTVQFMGNGVIEKQSTMPSRKWNFKSFKFTSYAPDCDPPSIPPKIIELTSYTGVRSEYLLRVRNDIVEFYEIRHRKDQLTTADVDFVFSLSALR